ncbi:MAG: hypothetical protein MJZ13_07470 [Bacteroidales bacterium]|nr:hypothetical protein [Bacteroidales bacterium]
MSENKTVSLSDKEFEETSALIDNALKVAEYRMLREKAMKNEILIQNDQEGNVIEVPAREVFVRLYNEPVPSF